MNKEISNFLKHNHSSFKKIIKILESKFEYVSILATDCEGKELMVSEKVLLLMIITPKKEDLLLEFLMMVFFLNIHLIELIMLKIFVIELFPLWI